MVDVPFATSGSTGDSKRILRSEASLSADALALVSAFSDLWGSCNAVVATIRPEHMYGALWRVRAPAVAKVEVEPAVVVSVEEVVAACARHGRILFVTTPSFLEKALHHPDFPALKGGVVGVITSGSLLRRETALAVANALGVCPLEIFGSTETGTVAWRRQAEGEEWHVMQGVSASAAEDGRLVVDSPFAMSRPFKMSDAVKFVSEDAFLLLGRTDRVVKILEKHVSLVEIERAFESHPLVARACAAVCAGDVPRIGVLVVLNGEGRAALASGSYSAVASRLRRDLLPSVGGVAFPRRIRFVRALPVNEQGKTTAFAVQSELAEWCQEPVVLDWRETGTELSAKMVFPPDSEFFNGHFPDFPVLPGVAQLYVLCRFAGRAFGDFPAAAVYRRLKFQRIILPEREVKLEVSRRGEGSFEFSFSCANGPCSSGIVERTSS